MTGADVLLILGFGNPLCSRPLKLFEWIIAALVSSQQLAYFTVFNRNPGVCSAHLHGIDYCQG